MIDWDLDRLERCARMQVFEYLAETFPEELAALDPWQHGQQPDEDEARRTMQRELLPAEWHYWCCIYGMAVTQAVQAARAGATTFDELRIAALGAEDYDHVMIATAPSM